MNKNIDTTKRDANVKMYYNMLSYETHSQVKSYTDSFEQKLKEMIYDNNIDCLYDVEYEIRIIPKVVTK